MSKLHLFRQMLSGMLIISVGFFSFAQTVKLSSYINEGPDQAMMRLLKSSIDTVIVDYRPEPWVFGPMRFVDIGNKTILFEKNVVVKAKPNAFPSVIDALFKFVDCNNINLVGNHNSLSMNKREYSDGEWRHIIRLRGCSNVKIENFKLSDSGGDGITIGGGEKNLYSKDIHIENIESINNKRQGISIVSAENVYVKNSIFSETKGTLPGAGVDIEPDNANERIVNVVFDSCVFKNNYNAGIKIDVARLTDESKPISISFKDCLLQNNFSPENGKLPAEITIRANKLKPVKGQIIFEDCLITESNWRFLYAQKNHAGFHVDFKNVAVKNICKAKPTSAIYLETPHYREKSNMGGFKFDSLYLEYSIDYPIIQVRGSQRGVMEHFKDVSGKIIIKRDSNNIKNPIGIEYVNYDADNNEGVDLDFIYIK